MAIWLGCNPCRYESGRSAGVDLIVIHWMAGSWQSANARFQSDCSNDPGQGSAHYGVRQDGQLVQWVREQDTSYQAGDPGVNARSIGIEHEAAPGWDFSGAGYLASAALVADLRARYGLGPDRVVPHNSIVATQCPGTISIARILQPLLQEVTGGSMLSYRNGDPYRADLAYLFSGDLIHTWAQGGGDWTTGAALLESWGHPPGDPIAEIVGWTWNQDNPSSAVHGIVRGQSGRLYQRFVAISGQVLQDWVGIKANGQNPLFATPSVGAPGPAGGIGPAGPPDPGHRHDYPGGISGKPHS